jgi:hypothetical protein
MFEGHCSKGKDGTFYNACQTCSKYKPKVGALPARKNLKRQKTDKARERDIQKMMRSY